MQEKIVLASTSVVALALGMGVGASPAQADLIITPFTPADNATLAADGVVNFGPDGGFNAQLISMTDFKFDQELELTGVNENLAAVTSPGCTSDCTLQTLNPGDVVDGSLNFAQSGTFTTYFKCAEVTSCNVADGNYYFGLDAVEPTEPFGWMEITVSGGNPTLDEFAFENVEGVGAPIPTSSVPEPATLALFGVGAAAVLAARRRRRQPAL